MRLCLCVRRLDEYVRVGHTSDGKISQQLIRIGRVEDVFDNVGVCKLSANDWSEVVGVELV